MKIGFWRTVATGTVASVLGLATAVAASVTITDTGPDSSNRVVIDGENTVRVSNDNDVSVDNNVDQSARTGDAEVERNTNAGDATSGDASNTSDLALDILISNTGWDFSGLFGDGGGWDVVIDTTGPDSNNRVNIDSDNSVRISNDNDVDVDNNVDQDARSGDAEVSRNTNGGSATSGDASNSSSVSTNVEITNGGGGTDLGGLFSGGGGSATIDTTGPDSNNVINIDSSNSLRISNNNDVSVDNNVDQSARSGDAEVSRNTNGGDATSGDATNESTVETNVTIEN